MAMLTPLLCSVATLALPARPGALQGQIPIDPWIHGPPSPCLPFAPENSIPWPGAGFGNPADFGRMVAADLDGDQATEAVLIAGGVAVALWKVAVYDAPIPVSFAGAPAPTSVADLAALPGGAPGGADAVLMTDERGLFRVHFENGGFHALVLEGSAWADAAPIHTDDLDGDGDLDVVGLGQDRLTVLTLLATDVGFFPGLTLTMDLPLREVVAVNWNQAGPRELALLSARGMIVLDALGQTVELVPHLSATGCLARFAGTGAAGTLVELLAWTRESGTQTELLVLDASGTEGTWPLSFDVCGAPTAIQPHAVLAGNYDGNDEQELLLVHDASRTAIVLANRGPVARFDPQNPAAFDVIPLSEDELLSGGTGIPIFAQVDGDGPDDLVFAVEPTESVNVSLSLPFERALVGSLASSAGIVSPRTEFGIAENGILRLAFTVPARYRTHTFLDLVVWHEPGPVGEGYVLPDAVSHRRHPLLGAPGPSGVEVVSPLRQWVEVEYPFPGGACWAGDPPCFYTEFRFVRVDGSHEEKSPVYTGGFTVRRCSTGSPNSGYLVPLGIPGSSFSLRQHNGLTGPGMGTGAGVGTTARQMVGIYVPMSSQPPFQDGILPDPGERGVGGVAHIFYQFD
jgi:hypothetical protein